MPTAITSAQNPFLKEIRRATDHAELTPDGYCVAESIHLLEEAVRSGRPMKAVLCNEAGRARLSRIADLPRKVPVYDLEESLFARIATTEASQGVVCLVKPPEFNLQPNQVSLALVVDGVQDPGNAGAIVRSAEAFGVNLLLFLKGAASPYHPKTLRASAGSLFRLPVRDQLTVTGAVEILMESGLRVFGAMPKGGQPAWAVDWRGPSAIVIGSEGAGLNRGWDGYIEPVSLPTERVESLNAGVAAAVLLYEAHRQRNLEHESI